MLYLVLSLIYIRKKIFSFDIFILTTILSNLIVNKNNILTIDTMVIYLVITSVLIYIYNIVFVKKNIIINLYHKYLYKIGLLIYIYVLFLTSIDRTPNIIDQSFINYIIIALYLSYLFINKNEDNIKNYIYNIPLIFIALFFNNNYQYILNIIILITFIFTTDKNIIDLLLKFNVSILTALTLSNMFFDKHIYDYISLSNLKLMNLSLYIITSYLLFVSFKFNKLSSIIISVLILLAFILYI